MTDLRSLGTPPPWFLRRDLSAQDRQRLLTLPERLRARIVGQDDAIEAVTRPIIRRVSGMHDPERPVATLLFPGPTGTGKTELARALADELYGTDTGLLRLDMSEYAEGHNVARLIGSPPGYADSDKGGQLTGHFQAHPYSVILLDEIEKAHRDVFKIFLQMFDAGRITDGQGHTHRCTGSIIILTSNAGTSDMEAVIDDPAAMARAIHCALKAIFPPELLNRLDAIVMFRPLSAEALGRIVDIQLAVVVERAHHQGLTVIPSPATLAALARDGYDPLNGARPLRRLIEREIADPLADGIVFGPYAAGDTVAIDHDGDRYLLRRSGTRPQPLRMPPQPPPEPPAPPREQSSAAPPAAAWSAPADGVQEIVLPAPRRTSREIAADRRRLLAAMARQIQQRRLARADRARRVQQLGEALHTRGLRDRAAQEERGRAFCTALDARGGRGGNGQGGPATTNESHKEDE